MSEYELYHYGVLGMKWGVRRGRTAEAYEKASKKLNKLNTRIEKKENKARKKAAIADRREYSIFSTDRRRARAHKKAQKASYKVSKKVAKANKWLKSMEKTFRNTDVHLSKEQLALGKAYIEKLNMRATMREFR